MKRFPLEYTIPCFGFNCHFVYFTLNREMIIHKIFMTIMILKNIKKILSSVIINRIGHIIPNPEGNDNKMVIHEMKYSK
jgi:hypothetical protein